MFTLSLASSVSADLCTAAAMSVACAALSVFVVSRRWAFIGEGISHGGLGGAGAAWMLALAFPGSFFERDWMPYCGVIAFSLVAAGAIGMLTRRGRINSDSAIGILMVASFAFGVIAQSLYVARRHAQPVGWTVYLFGDARGLSPAFAMAAVAVCIAVLGTVLLLGKEILYYCFDPAMAEASGVRAGFIHYLLMFLVALTIVIGARVVGTVLVTALLVLPGATALLLTRTLGRAMAAAIAVALAGAMAGLAVSLRWPAIPSGPAIVLCLFCLFLLVLSTSRWTGAAA